MISFEYLKYSLLRIGASICILLTAGMVHAQLEVENTQTVEWYILNKLIGQGVTVSNIEVNGMPANQTNVQVGEFSEAEADLGVASGLIMGTGDVLMASQDNTGVGSSLPGSGDDYSDSDLEGLTPFSVNDQCVIEFDFIPTGDTLRFNYAFASEEYPEYVCGTANDVFGFFISGPNPAGGTYDNQNIALIPDPADPETYTNTPVSINTVNPGVPGYITGGDATNCDNADPSWADYNVFYLENTTGEYEYDGQTIVLTALAIVECGETYHIKLATGDGADTAFDSAVFLEEGSFSSDLVISAALVSSIGPYADGYLYENCGHGIIEYVRNGGIELESVVELTITGVAQNGIDYTTVPSSFTFPAGDSIFVMQIEAILDGIEEDLEEVTISISNTSESACASGSVTSEFSFLVSDDPEPLAIGTENHSIDCGEMVDITASVTGGYGQYVFAWSNGVLDSTQTVNPGFTTEYIVTVTDTCNAGSVSSSVTVDVPVYPPLIVDLAESTVLTCLEVIELMADEVSGGNGDYSYIWTQADGTLIGDDSPTLTYVGSSTEVISLSVTDGCFTTASDAILMDVPVIPLLITTSPDTITCKGDPAMLSAAVTGGEAPYIYNWSHFSADETSVVVSPFETSIYQFSVTDLCLNTETADIRVEVSEAQAIFAVAEQGYYGVELENFSSSSASEPEELSYIWDMGDGTVYSSQDVIHDYYDLNDHTIILEVINEHGCSDTASANVEGPPSIFIPTSFSPNNDGINDSFKVYAEGAVEFRLLIFDRWGAVVFETVDPDQAWNGQGRYNSESYSENGSYIYRIKARMRDGERVDQHGIVTLFR